MSQESSEKRLADQIFEKLNSDPKISARNKKAMKDYVLYLQAKNSDNKTIAKELYSFGRFVHALGGKIDVMKATRKELEAAVAHINASDYADWTKETTKSTIKSFYKHFIGEDLYYPKQIAWLKGKRPRSKLMPKDILTEDDVLKMLEAAWNARDKAIISVLFDAGMRIGELLSLSNGNVVLNSNPAYIVVPVEGKTGTRKVPIIFSVHYLSAYINSKRKSRPEDPLWTSYQGKKLEYRGTAEMIKETARKAGIRKRIYPHLFRHSRVTSYANKLKPQQLKKFFGWTPSSRMLDTYEHLADEDIENAILSANDLGPKVEKAESKLTAKACGRCGFTNGAEATYCNRCGAALDISTVMKEKELEQKAAELAAKSFEDRDITGEVIRKIRGRRKERK